MRDPQSAKFQHVNALMATGQMFGMNRPVTRVTAVKQTQRPYSSNRPGPWRGELFDPIRPENTTREVTNLVSVDINRGINDDSATCTIVIYNQEGNDQVPEGIDTGIGQPGYLTFNRGSNKKGQHSIYEQLLGAGADVREYPTDWEYRANIWKDFFIPNTLLRTYQGYGSDNFDIRGNEIYVHDPGSEGYVHPANDTKLFQTGTWLIDKVTYSADGGSISIECRDMAKLLLDQFIFPPMLPLERFPLIYCPAHADQGHKGVVGRNVAVYNSCSNDPYVGKDGSEYGHHGKDAFDGKGGSYWLSVGNADPDAGYAYEWIQASTNNHQVNEVTLDLFGDNYVIYVSVYENGSWQGTSTVPYNPADPNSFPNGANIKYVKQVTSGSTRRVTIPLPRTYKAQYVRVGFHHLFNSGIGVYPYRAGVREMTVRQSSPSTFIKGSQGIPGYISGWDEVIKELLGWAGFTWYNAPTSDPLLGKENRTGYNLRVWGDFETQVGPQVCTPADYFMNKSFMEGIRQVSDFLGTLFRVDEGGAAILRQPNIWSVGNYIDDPTAPSSEPAHITGHPIEFHENANLTSYSVMVDDSQVRSEILVTGYNPDVLSSAYVAGGYVLGKNSVTGETSAIDFTNVLAGQQRLFVVPNSATSFFRTEIECQRMAELIGLQILFSYRRGQLRSPAHPGLQIDDQVRIFERTTNENNVHYVSGLNTHWDAASGEYTMEVTTHWLGEDPNTKWFVNQAQLTPAVTSLPAIAKRIGRQGVSGDPNQTPPYNTEGFGALGQPFAQ